ncbi:hypothetical protein M885DRAFT_574432 [Pelagophyceae sp. CCMP2097]|nr:hypothetical protein M885DRAFT_574432 [Pelagophyceae sp. CCMP2097]
MLAACRRMRPRPAGAAAARLLSGAVYDSQSGMWRDLDPPLRLYELTPRKKAAPNEIIHARRTRWFRVPDGASIRLAPAISHDATLATRGDALALAKKAHDLGIPQHVVVTDAFDADGVEMQQLIAELADLDVRSIMLCTSPTTTHDDMEELVDLLGEVDVSGLTMRQRLGLRLDASADVGAAVDFAAKALKIKQFDCDAVARRAPATADLIDALTAQRAFSESLDDYEMIDYCCIYTP